VTKKVPSYHPRQYTVNPPVRPIGKATVSMPASNQRNPHIPTYEPRYQTPNSRAAVYDRVRAVQQAVHSKKGK